MSGRETRCNNSLSRLLVVTLLDSQQFDDLACNSYAYHSSTRLVVFQTSS